MFFKFFNEPRYSMTHVNNILVSTGTLFGNAEMSSAAMEIFTEFLENKNVSVTLKKLEAARKVHY